MLVYLPIWVLILAPFLHDLCKNLSAKVTPNDTISWWCYPLPVWQIVGIPMLLEVSICLDTDPPVVNQLYQKSKVSWWSFWTPPCFCDKLITLSVRTHWGYYLRFYVCNLPTNNIDCDSGLLTVQGSFWALSQPVGFNQFELLHDILYLFKVNFIYVSSFIWWMYLTT